MVAEGTTWQESLTINIDGGLADRHEIEANTLADSLLGLDQLAQKINSSINQKETTLSVRIKGGFEEGSFDYQAILDFIGAVMPAIPQVVETIKQVIEYKKFLGGEPPAKIETEPEGQMLKVENHNGNVMNVVNSTVVIAESPQAALALQKMFKPLDNGATKMELVGGNVESAPVVVTRDERNAVISQREDSPVVDEKNCVLEVLTAQMDGKTDGWRFYNVDEETEFTATVEDFDFLTSIKESRYAVIRNRHANAVLKTIRQKINGRTKTIRKILKLTPLSDQEERALFV